MIREDKQLLLQDLCARLPYGVIVDYKENEFETPHWKITTIHPNTFNGWIGYDKRVGAGSESGSRPFHIGEVKPYLRPMSSMTEEEKKELLNHVLGGEGVEYFHIAHDGSIDGNQETEQDLYNLNLHWLNFDPLTTSRYIDWLNKKMFDYRGLIPKGLANSTEKFNPYI